MKNTTTAFPAASIHVPQDVSIIMRFAELLFPQRYQKHFRVCLLAALGFWVSAPTLEAQLAVDYSTIVSSTTDAANNLAAIEDNGKIHWMYNIGTTAYYRQIDAATGNTLVGPLVKQSGVTVFSGVSMKASGGILYVAASVNGELLYMKIDIASGNTLFSETVASAGAGGESFPLLDVGNGKVYIALSCGGTGFPGASGTLNGPSDGVYVRYDATSNVREFATYIGGSGGETVNSVKVSGADLIVGFRTSSPDFPVTNASTNSGGFDLVYARLNPTNGAILTAAYIGSSATGESGIVKELNGEIFVLAGSVNGTYPSTVGPVQSGVFAALTKLDRITGNIIFSRHLPLTGGPIAGSIELHGGILYITSQGNGGVNNGSFYKVAASNGDLIFATALPINPLGGFIKDGDRLIFSGSVRSVSVNFEWAISKWSDATGQQVLLKRGVEFGRSNIVYSFLTGNSLHTIPLLQINTRNYPTTDGTKKEIDINNAIAYTKFNICPYGWSTGADALTPASQTVCQNALVNEIQGQPIVVPSSALPPIYLHGVQASQPAIEAFYQWQEATAPGGPWADIPGAVFQNYSPSPIITTRYFRRLALTHPCCGSTLISTSQVATVQVNSFMAPVVNAGGVYNTCPGVNVTLNATVTGGTTPYMLDWDQGATDGTLTPTVTPASNTIYTLLVTDANGCVQVDQALVNTYTADAGPATAGSCAGDPVLIGTAPIPGLSGVVYDWSPATGLSCTNCAQPLATPASSTTYTFTLTIPISSGGTCQTTDMITVNPVAAPTNNGGAFAGPDVSICRGSTALLGTPAEAGFTYTWAPGNYLTNNAIAQPTFQPGSLAMPDPNPILYYVTAQRLGCVFVDSMYASVIEARAWIDGCGPREIGMEDRTPDINETYLWVNLGGGESVFTGPTNTPQTTVSATTTANTVYELQVTYMGTTCTDQVIVTPPCDCNVEIEVDAPFVCPSFGLNGGMVTLRAKPVISPGVPESSYIYTWSVVGGPNAGLNTYTGKVVQLTDNVNRTYRVTLTSSVNPNFMCFQDIEVNNPAWSLPVFSAMDVNGCAGTMTPIGQPTVADYTYAWSPTDGLNDPMISMPVLTISGNGNYIATVTDTRSGCVIKDTIAVTQIGLIANAGPDRLVCDAGTVTLGTPAVAGATYSWDPPNANWQNGTNQNSAQPEVLIAINTMFTVTVTKDGCISTDEVQVNIGSPVTPFVLPNISYCPSVTPVTLGNDAPTGLASYSWAPAGSLTTPTMRVTDVKSPIPVISTTYTLTVRNIDGCEFQTTQTIVPVITPPDAGPNQTICVGEATPIGSASNPTGAGISYDWTSTNPANLAMLSSTSSPNPTFTPTTTGSFVFTLTKMEAGCSSSATVTILVNGLTLPSIASPTICQGASVQIGTAAVVGVQYFWSPATGLSGTTVSNPIVSGITETTTYTLTAIDANGCSATATVVVGVNPVPAPTLTIPAVTACLGDNGVSINTTVAPAGTYTYLWAPNNGSLNTIYSEDPEVLLFGIGVQSYTVTVTNTATGCSTVGNASVTVEQCCPAVPAVNITETNVNVCGTSAATFNYTVTNGPTTTFSHTGQGTLSLSQLPNGTGTFTYTPAIADAGTVVTITAAILGTGGCATATDMATVTVSSVPTVNTPGNQTVCHNTMTTAVTFTGTAARYDWTNNTPSIGLAASGTGNIAAFTAMNAGASNVTATITVTPRSVGPDGTIGTADDCIGTAQTFTITVTPRPAHGTPTTNAGSCTGPTANNDAEITVPGITNGDRIGISTAGAASYDGPAYAAPATTILGGMHTFTGLMHNTQYRIRIFNGGNDCFTDVVVTTASASCCTVTINSSTPSVCDPATNKYSLAVNVSWTLASGTTLTVSVPGGSATLAVTAGSSGTNQTVTITGLTADGTQDIDVTAQFDATCTTTTTDAYDAPANCCPPPYSFCAALGENFDLTAQTGLTGYQWYLNGNPIAGANAALYNTNVAGVYTWTALDAGNCPIGGCCPITLVENCTCTNPTHNAPTTAQGTCTGGTPNNNATITVTGIANADRIGISTGATYSGTPAYAAATNIAGAMHTFTGLMHNTQYTIRLFNGADNCFTDVTITTASITCVLPPMLTHDKTGPVIGTQQPNGSYNVTYTITVTNSGGGAGTYSLYDTPTFDDDIAINGTPNFTTNAPGHPANPGPVNLSSINGTSNTLATGQAIAANATHTYTLTYNVTLNLEPGSGGNNVYTACGSVAPGTPVAGQGLFNQSRLDAGNDGTIDETDEVCGDLPYLVLVKTADNLTDNGNDNYTITYILTVSNLGGAAANYTLTDTPGFDDDATITGASYTALLPPAAVTAPITLSPIPPAPSWGIGTANQAIAAGAVHTYTLTVTANVDLSAGSTGNNFFRNCVTTTTTTSMPGDAFFNSAQLQGMGTTTVTRVRQTCIDPRVSPSGYSIGSTVFRDLNNNGLQDPTETGIAGVTMQIWEVVGVKDPTPGSPAGADGADILVPVGSDGTLETADDALPYVSDAAGNYFFTGLSARSYYVVIPGTAFGAGGALQMLPTSSSPAVTDTNDNREDGDDNGVQMGGSGMMVMSPVIALGPGEVEPTGASESYQGGTQDDGDLDDQGDMTVDFGFFQPVSLGDTTWVDLNGNGRQDALEPPLPGVKVTLFNAATNTMVTTDANGNTITGMTTTNSMGFYEFTNLSPGNYYVVFDISMVANPEYYALTTANQGPDTDDSDADPVTGQTAPTGFLPSGTRYPDLDAGVVCQVSANITVMQVSTCSTRSIELSTLGASITPSTLNGVWSTSGTGVFLDAGLLGVNNNFLQAGGGAGFYLPSPADIAAGSVTLTLTTNTPPAGVACPAASDTVQVIILKVDCGNFPWDGN